MTASKQQEPTIFVHFWLPRDLTQYEGLAFDELSSSGVAFVTKRELTMRQLLNISLVFKMPGEKEGKATPVVPAEITQVDVLGSGWRAYARFLEEDEVAALSGEDRRQQTRHPVNLKGEYTTVPGMPPHTCRIDDVSKGGVAIISDQGLKVGKHISLHVFAGDDNKIMIDAEVEVKRSQHKGHGVYEIGVSFLHNYSRSAKHGGTAAAADAPQDAVDQEPKVTDEEPTP